MGGKKGLGIRVWSFQQLGPLCGVPAVRTINFGVYMLPLANRLGGKQDTIRQANPPLF